MNDWWTCPNPGCGFRCPVPAERRLSPGFCPACGTLGPDALAAEDREKILRSYQREADPFPNVPTATTFGERWRARRVLRRRRRQLRRRLEQAHRTLEILAASDRVDRFKEDVAEARTRVQQRWKEWIAAEDAWYAELRARSLRISAIGVPKRASSAAPPPSRSEVET